VAPIEQIVNAKEARTRKFRCQADQYSLCSKIRPQEFFCGRTHKRADFFREATGWHPFVALRRFDGGLHRHARPRVETNRGLLRHFGTDFTRGL